MKTIPTLIVTGALVAAFGGGWYFSTLRHSTVQSQRESEPQSGSGHAVTLFAQGRLIPRGGIVNIFAPPGQRIAQILVSEGLDVEAGQTELAKLDGWDALRLRSELADAEADAANKELQQRLVAAESAVAAAAHAVQAAELAFQQAQDRSLIDVNERQLVEARQTLQRLQALAADPLTSLYVAEGKLREQELELARSEAALATARRQQEHAQASAALGLEMARKNQQAAEHSFQLLQPLVQESRAQLLTRQLAQRQLDEARLIAPISGTVLKVHIKPGEAVTALPLMQIGNLNQMECVAEVVDQLVPRLAIGQPVKITHSALPGPLRGTIRQIGKLVGNSSLPNPNPLAMVDRRSVEVVIGLEESASRVARNLVNLQVTVEIEAPTGPFVPLDSAPAK